MRRTEQVFARSGRTASRSDDYPVAAANPVVNILRTEAPFIRCIEADDPINLYLAESSIANCSRIEHLS